MESPPSENNNSGVVDYDEQFPEFQGWESIGFHRGLGREFWQLIIELFTSALGIFVISILMPILEPYPEVSGYQNIARPLFAVIFSIFDMGTNFGLSRFIAEHRIKNFQRMIQYISFTIWWQSWTGLIQITILSYFTFEILVHSNYSYLTWMLLIIVSKQYPGWLGLFKEVLNGMQHYDKVEIIGFLQGQIVERITTIGSVVLFTIYGKTHPEMGVLMGIILGTLIGTYIDDFVFEFLSAYFLNRILKKHFGMTIWDMFRVKYNKDVLKEIMFFGFQGSVLPIIGSFVTTYQLLLMVNNISAYATWYAIIKKGITFSGQINQFGDFSLRSAIAESYPSGKKTLAEFYITYSFKWRYMFITMLAIVTIAMIPYFNYLVYNLPAFQYYIGAEKFIVAGIVVRVMKPFLELPDSVMLGASTKFITPYNIIRVLEEGMKVFFIWLFVIVLRVQDNWGLFGLVLLIEFTNHVPWIIKTIICYIYIELKILHINIYWRSTFIIPIIAALPNIPAAAAWYKPSFLPMVPVIGIEGAVAISAAMFFIFVLLTYFPLIALLGGFDDYQLFVFKKAGELAGPSKKIFLAVYTLMCQSVKIAKKFGWHARFPIPYEEAHKEIYELMVMKRELLEKRKNKN